jgi:nucleoside-diphosphate-sugar epimerase
MVSIRDFVQIVQRISKSKSKLLFGEKQMRVNEYEVSNISAEISELNKLGWFPETSLEQGIESLINYLAHSKS